MGFRLLAPTGDDDKTGYFCARVCTDANHLARRPTSLQNTPEKDKKKKPESKWYFEGYSVGKENMRLGRFAAGASSDGIAISKFTFLNFVEEPKNLIVTCWGRAGSPTHDCRCVSGAG